jgi:hypothetical protein
MDLLKLAVMEMVAITLKPTTVDKWIELSNRVLNWLGKDEPVVDETGEDSDNVIHLVVTPDETGTEH